MHLSELIALFLWTVEKDDCSYRRCTDEQISVFHQSNLVTMCRHVTLNSRSYTAPNKPLAHSSSLLKASGFRLH